ncbi:hypothetical protein JTE90_027787 [Oedothorax gibbosus]|uniref:Uncharacterized protein n=1 Tax=Oedothorax gibbosus TaxID=931172 RepID=A0AAV6V868_9ARAC|nr:hypothetical protein JTE90_027787 [Oedothorax gibbosus]
MALRLYFDLMSQPCRALDIFLRVNKIPFETKLVALRKGEHLGEEFAKLNPFKKVPVLEKDGFVLTESIAIVRYIAREYNIQDNWYPKDTKSQARVDEYLEWQHLNTRLFGTMVFRERVITPMLEQKPVNMDKMQFYKNGFVKALDDIENIFLKDRPYISGDTISVADIFCACEIEQPLMVGYNPLEDFSKVNSWMKKVRKELDPYYTEAHKVTEKMKMAIASGKL